MIRAMSARSAQTVQQRNRVGCNRYTSADRKCMSEDRSHALATLLSPSGEHHRANIKEASARQRTAHACCTEGGSSIPRERIPRIRALDEAVEALFRRQTFVLGGRSFRPVRARHAQRNYRFFCPIRPSSRVTSKSR